MEIRQHIGNFILEVAVLVAVIVSIVVHVSPGKTCEVPREFGIRVGGLGACVWEYGCGGRDLAGEVVAQNSHQSAA